MFNISINIEEILENVVRLSLAFILAFPIGWERGRGRLSIGLRTFPIVAMGSCGFMLLARMSPDASADNIARILQGVIAGIGFIGGGAIIKKDSTSYGVVTAASIWNTGAIGVAVAAGREEIAISLAIFNFLTLYFLTPIIQTTILNDNIKKKIILLNKPEDSGYKKNKKRKNKDEEDE